MFPSMSPWWHHLFLGWLLAGTAVVAMETSARNAAITAGQAVVDRQCVKCHGPLEKKGGLELDTPAAVLKGGREGPVLVPGHPETSKLILALSPEADPHMPPKKQISEAEISVLRAWVAALGEVAAEPASLDPTPVLSPEAAAHIPGEATAAIDYLLQAGWKQRGIQPTGLCDDLTFVRRVYLDLAGRIPRPEEVAGFVQDAGSQKREQCVDRLLANEEYARTQREFWDAILMGRHAGRREKRRQENGWFSFLEDAFRRNRPWNEVVSDLVVARPGSATNSGAAWFLYERKNDHQQMAEAVAPLIYGTRVDCAQCHDHPLSREIKQAHYWALVAAFNRSKNVEGGPPMIAESAIGGFINFTNLKKESQPAVLTLLNGRVIPEDRPAADAKEDDGAGRYVDASAKPKVPKFSRRAELARAVTQDNPLLARAFVNFTWAQLMGRGIVHPVDEINSKHPPSHPELLNWLASDFQAHGQDVRRLVRAIVLSRGYQLAPPSGADRPAPEAFAAAAERSLLAETIARSAQIASGRTAVDPVLRQALIEAFPDVLPRVTRATIQQAMLLAYNERLEALFASSDNEPGTKPAVPLESAVAVREVFQRILIRDADTEELARAVAFLEQRRDRPAAALAQLRWALVAGPEFLINR